MENLPEVTETVENIVANSQSILANSETVGADVESIDKELKDLYDTVYAKINISVANNDFTMESLEVILSKVTETVQEMSDARATKLTGVEKRNIGLNLLKMVLSDLHEKGKISDELYSAFNMTLTYVAPVLFYAAKEAWRKLQEVHQDIERHGCDGCFSRNFCRK